MTWVYVIMLWQIDWHNGLVGSNQGVTRVATQGVPDWQGVDTSDPGPSQCDGPVTRRGLVRPHCATFEDKMQTRLRADTQPITDSPSKCKLRLYSHCKAVLLLHHNQWPWMEELTSKWHNQGLYSLSHSVAGLDLQFIIAIRCKKLVHPRKWF